MNCKNAPEMQSVPRLLSVIVAVDSFIFLVGGLNLIPPKRGTECLANCFQSKILNSCLANSPSVYI